MDRRFLKLEGDRVVGFDPAHEGAERTVAAVNPRCCHGHTILECDGTCTDSTRCTPPRLPESTVDAMRKIHEQIWKDMDDARKTPEYFEEAFDRGIISVGQVFEMLVAFKEARDEFVRVGQLTINELRAVCELRSGDIPQEEIRQVIMNISKRLK